MNSLSDHVDRISALAKSIRSVASSASPVISGPFTEAVLHAPLGDLIRDIDPAELGLFTLVEPAKPASDLTESSVMHGEVVRAEFHGATPLKKPPAPRPGRLNPQRPGEHEPEIYARAALKYLSRYQLIRPMPRASEQAVRIKEQLKVVRENIRNLNEKLAEHAPSSKPDPPASPKALIKSEEDRIQDARARIAELRKQKDMLTKQKAKAKLDRSRAKPKPETPPADSQEETFWNTPAASARVLHFVGDSLLDEHIDVGDISTMSYTSPLSARNGNRLNSLSGANFTQLEPNLEGVIEEGTTPISPVDPPLVAANAYDLHEDEGEQTIVLDRSHSSTDREPMSYVPDPEHMPRPKPSEIVEADHSQQSKIKFTSELERIVALVWGTIGEVIMPGHPFDVAGDSGGSRPPRAKETIAHLQSLSSRSPAPVSPSHSSLSSFNHGVTSSTSSSAASSQPTAQQVLTAHMLLMLFSAPPLYAMPLLKLKDALSSKAAEIGASAIGGSVVVTRPLYGCVAKRLLKIDRGGGEQVVKFNM